MLPRLVLVITVCAFATAGCNGGGRRGAGSVTQSASPPAAVGSATRAATTATATGVAATLTRGPAATATPHPTPAADALDPAGYPLDPDVATDRVVGATGARTIAVGQGASVRETSEQLQVSPYADAANADGWDCRVHVEYEGAPAVDWYVQPGTPVRATMDGTATLLINTVANAFDYYRVSREPYIGNPDRARAPVSPFPGPGGGMGVEVAVVNARYRTDYGHLDIARTLDVVPDAAFGAGYSRAFDYAAHFATPRVLSSADVVATWEVRRGDVIGYTGDAGYSEAPHLHYTITRRSDGARLCPTSEPGFEDGGWLEK